MECVWFFTVRRLQEWYKWIRAGENKSGVNVSVKEANGA